MSRYLDMIADLLAPDGQDIRSENETTINSGNLDMTRGHDWGAFIDARTAEAAVNEYGLLSRVMTVTPDMAEWVLEHRHPRNRMIQPKRVKQYAADIASGRWKLSAEAVKFSRSGNLVDGQHRLAACVVSKVPLTTQITFGVPDDAFDVMDTGAVRGAKDVLSIAGIDHGKELAAAARIIIPMQTGSALTPDNMYRAITNPVVHEFVRANEADLLNSLKMGRNVYASLPRARLSVATAMHFLLSERNYVAADDFFSKLASGEGLSRGDPIYALRDRFIRMRAEKKGGKGSYETRWIIESYIRAWNAYRECRSLLRLQCEDTIPEIRG